MSTGEQALHSTARVPWRPWALVLLTTALAALALAAAQSPSFGWDRAIAGWLPALSHPAFDALMEAVSVPGERAVVWATILLGAAAATWRLGWRAGLLVLLALGALGFNEALKDVIDRPRPLEPPTGGGESFPSGHTVHAVLTAGLVWLLAGPLVTRRRALAAALIAWPLLVGVSRVHLEQHWPSDVLGAYLLGAAAVVALGWVWQYAHRPLPPLPFMQRQLRRGVKAEEGTP